MKGCKPDSVKHMHDKDVANGRMPVEGRYTVIGSGPDCKSGTFGSAGSNPVLPMRDVLTFSCLQTTLR